MERPGLDHIVNTLTRLEIRLWFLPALMSLGAVALAWLSLGAGGAGMPLAFVGNAAAAQALLSTLLSALITMTTLVVSITVVALSVAASQLGPRLILNFTRDKQIQAMLGLFMGTILYCLVVLLGLNDEPSPETVPRLAVSLAALLAILCLFALLFYINKVAVSIMADTVVRHVADALEQAIDKAPSRERSSVAPEEVEGYPHRSVLSVGRTGYVQVVEFDHLCRVASAADLQLHLQVRAGHFILRDGNHAEIRAQRPPPPEVLQKLREAFIVGHARTPTQDLEYSVRQLVEIAVRALSPGINDPFTAIEVINRLGAALEAASRITSPDVHVRDEHGVLRVIGESSDFPGLVNSAFDQIRQNASAHPAVFIQFAHIFDQLAQSLTDSGQRRALRKQLEKIERAARRHIVEEGDREDFDAVCKVAMERLKAPSVADDGGQD